MENNKEETEKIFFVGREKEIKKLRLLLTTKHKPDDIIPLWHIHGPSGIGKTTLLKEFERIASEEYAVQTVYIDFDPLSPDKNAAELRTPAGFIKRIVDSGGFKRDWENTKSVLDEYDKSYKKAFPASKTTSNLLQRLVEVGGIAVNFSLPEFSPVFSGFKKLGGALNILLEEKVSGEFQKMLFEFDTKLIEAFKKDIDELDLKNDGSVIYLILIDTFEKYEVDYGTESDYIHKLLKTLTKKIQLISVGRNEHYLLHEMESAESARWKEYIDEEPKQIDVLSEKDVDSYMDHHGIKDDETRKNIKKVTQGFPICMRFLVRLLEVTKENLKGSDIAGMPGGYQKDITQKFLFEKVLDRVFGRATAGGDDKEFKNRLFYMTAGIPRIFNRQILTKLWNQEDLGWIEQRWKELEKIGIKKAIKINNVQYYTIHEALRKGIHLFWRSRYPDDFIKHHKILYKYFTNSGTEIEKIEALYHSWFIDSKKTMQSFDDLAEKLRKELKMTEYNRIVNDVASYIENIPFDDTAIRSKSLATIGSRLSESTSRDKGRILNRAIDLYKEALNICPHEAFPEKYAMTQNNLGIAYSELPFDDRSENLKKAIQCYNEALKIYTLEGFPEQYAGTQNNLGVANWDLPTGDRGENIKKVIHCYEEALKIYTLETFPADYAMTQNNLGNAYLYFPLGDRGKNLERAIHCYEEALKIRTLEAFPEKYAMTQNNLGIAYSDLPIGDREENLKKAIVCYEEALKVLTLEAFPYEYAMTQNNLGNAYLCLPLGDRGENLNKAIECCEEALKVYTIESFPENYAMTQNNLGTAYAELPEGDRGENLKKAIECYEEALKIRTLEAFPEKYAMTQNNLGTVYADLPAGDRGDNLKKAIECYEEALKIRTLEAFPIDYAMTQNNLGEAYRKSPEGDHRQNLRKAIECYDEALKIWTRKSFPYYHKIAAGNLAKAKKELKKYGKKG